MKQQAISRRAFRPGLTGIVALTTSLSGSVFVIAAPYQDAVNALSPNYYYQLNETDAVGGAVDSTGNAAAGIFNGDYVNGPAMVGAPGPTEVHGGIAVPGVGGTSNLSHASNNAGHITLGDGNSFGANAMTIALFIRAGQGAQGGDRVFTNNLTDASKSFQIVIGNNGLVLAVDPGAAGAGAERTLYLEDNSGPDRRFLEAASGWFHVVASTEGTTGSERAANFRLWVNGVDRTSNLRPDSTGWGTDTGMAKIGGRRANATDTTTHSGGQDEVAIWLDRVLSNNEIEGLWQAALAAPEPAPVGHWIFEQGNELNDLTGNFDDLVLEGNAEVVDGSLNVNGTGTTSTGWAHASSNGNSPPIGNKTLVSWITLESLDNVARTGSAISVDLIVGDRFDGIVFAERDANRWMNGSSGFQRTPPSQFDQTDVSVETSTGTPIQLAISYEDLGGGQVQITGYRNGSQMGTYSSANFASWSPGEYEVLFGPRHSNPITNPIGALDALVHEARLYDEVLTQEQIAALTQVSGEDSDGDGLPDSWEQELIDADPGDALESLADINPGDDLDGDNLTNLEEFELPRTNPLDPDSDGDGLNDDVETDTGTFVDASDTGTDPNHSDSDDDGLPDGVESGSGTYVDADDSGTDPTKADSDGDGLSDGDEVSDPFSDPNDPDDPSLEGFLVGHWTFEEGEELSDLTGNFSELVLEGDGAIVDGALDVNGSGTTSTGWAHASALPASSPLASKTLVSWITLESLDTLAKSGSALSVDLQNGDRFDGIVFAERNANRWMNGSSNFQRTPAEQFNQTDISVETGTGSQIQLAISYQELGGGQVQITGYRNGQEMGSYASGNFATWSAGEYEVLFGPRHSNPSAIGALDALIHEARLYSKALSGDEIAGLTPVIGEDIDGDGLPDKWEQAIIDSDPNDAINSLADLNPDDDLDGDNLTNLEESKSPRTDPLNPDTDGDGLTDDVETNTDVFVDENDTGTNPNKADSDGDGLGDEVETNTGVFVNESDTGTDPNEEDSDGDRFTDGEEVANATDPHDPNDPPPPSLQESLIGRWTFEPGEELTDLTGNFGELVLEGDAEIVDGALNINGAGTTSTGWAHAPALQGSSPVESKTLVAWLTLEGLDGVAKSGSPLAIDLQNGDRFDGIVFAERDANRWMNGSSFFRRTPAGQFSEPNAVETTTGEPIHLAITYEDLGGGQVLISGYRNGEEMGSYNSPNYVSWSPGEYEALFGPRHTNPNPNGALDALIEEARIYSQAATASQIMELFLAGPNDEETLNLAIANSGDDLVLTWESAGGKLYTLRSALDPASSMPTEWPIFEGHEEIVATPPINTLTIPRPADPSRYFVIEEFDAPPVAVYSDDFENGAGDWTVGSDGDAGTAWELGAPTNVGPEDAHSPISCFGTNLSSDYATDADIWLLSPEIDLTTAGGATLHYHQFVDIEEGFDLGTVSAVDAASGEELAVLKPVVDGLTADWEQVSSSIPAAALGKSIRIRFRFQSDNLENFAGWYLDDVMVTIP